MAKNDYLTSDIKDLAAQIKDSGTKKNTEKAKLSDLLYFWAWAGAAHQVEESYPVSWELLLNFIVTHLESKIPVKIDRYLVKNKYKAGLGGHKLKTVKRRVSTISWIHNEQGLTGDKNPAKHYEIIEVLRKAASDTKHKSQASDAVTKEMINQVLNSIGNNRLIDIRDKALIALTFSSGRRRSESTSLTIESMKKNTAHCAIFKLSHTKTSLSVDDTIEFKVSGKAHMLLNDWLTKAKITSGSIFRKLTKNGSTGETGISGTQLYRIIKRRFNDAHIENWDRLNITPHSLRSGFVSELGRKKGSIGDGMALTGHKSLQAFMNYYQAGEAENNTATDLLDD